MQKKEEVIDGVKIIRQGQPDLRNFFNSVQFKAFHYYRKGKFGSIDVVVDEIHGVPFFTPPYIKEKKTALICEYAGSLWDKAVRFPFNYFGKVVEHIYPSFYKRTSIITISESSKEEIKNNLFPNQKIEVIHPGCSTPVLTNPKSKPKDLNIVFIARISKTKGIEDAILAIEKIKEKQSNVTLHILGRGEKTYVADLKKMISVKKLSNNIVMHGFVSEKEKVNILDKSHFLLITSEKEGWGLTVHEANARGVPVVSYDISGVRDVIVKNKNGVLVAKNTPDEAANKILTLYANTKLYNVMAKRAIFERKKFSWDNTAQEFLSIINK